MPRWLPAGVACATVALLASAPGARAADAPRRTILHDFMGGADGNGSAVALATTADGAIYGVSATGGASSGCGHPGGCGTVFRLTKPAVSGDPWPLQTLHAFAPGAEGSVPLGSTPVLGPDGAVYGTADAGGPAGGGVVWRLAPPAAPGGSWGYAVLHGFDAAQPARGVNPDFGVVMDLAGTLYGLAHGGAHGTGVVFALDPPATPGAGWAERVLYDIPATPVAGATTVLSTGLALSHDQGELFGAYGIDALSPAASSTVFRLLRSPGAPGGGWTAKRAYSFANYGDFASLTVDAKRNVYGLFLLYGAAQNQFGSVFALAPPHVAGAAWLEHDLFAYTYRQVVYGGLARGRRGELFGTIGLTFGEPPDAIFRLDAPAGGGAGPWAYSTLYTFDQGGLHSPIVPLSLALDPGGNLVGVTAFGGARGKGVIFRQEIFDHAAP